MTILMTGIKVFTGIREGPRRSEKRRRTIPMTCVTTAAMTRMKMAVRILEYVTSLISFSSASACITTPAFAS